MVPANMNYKSLTPSDYDLKINSIQIGHKGAPTVANISGSHWFSIELVSRPGGRPEIVFIQLTSTPSFTDELYRFYAYEASEDTHFFVFEGKKNGNQIVLWLDGELDPEIVQALPYSSVKLIQITVNDIVQINRRLQGVMFPILRDEIASILNSHPGCDIKTYIERSFSERLQILMNKGVVSHVTPILLNARENSLLLKIENHGFLTDYGDVQTFQCLR